MEVDKIARQKWGWGEEKGRWGEKGKGKDLGDLRRMGLLRKRKSGYGGRKEDILNKGEIFGLTGDLTLERFPGDILHITIEPSSGNGWR